MRNSYKDLPEPKPCTVKIPARTVTAIRIATQLCQTGDAYHADAIDTATWKARNVELWQEAERAGVADDVMRYLRKAGR